MICPCFSLQSLQNLGCENPDEKNNRSHFFSEEGWWISFVNDLSAFSDSVFGTSHHFAMTVPDKMLLLSGWARKQAVNDRRQNLHSSERLHCFSSM